MCTVCRLCMLFWKRLLLIITTNSCFVSGLQIVFYFYLFIFFTPKYCGPFKLKTRQESDSGFEFSVILNQFHNNRLTLEFSMNWNWTAINPDVFVLLRNTSVQFSTALKETNSQNPSSWWCPLTKLKDKPSYDYFFWHVDLMEKSAACSKWRFCIGFIWKT